MLAPVRHNKRVLPTGVPKAAALGTLPAVLGDIFIKGEKHPQYHLFKLSWLKPFPLALLSHTDQHEPMLQPGVKY